MVKSNAVWFLLVALLGLGYPITYAVLRASHVLTHAAYFTSAEGLDARYVHLMLGNDSLVTFYSPLIVLELELQRRYKP